MRMSCRTDLAMESIGRAGRVPGVRQAHDTIQGIEKTEVNIDTQSAADALGKACGRYITLYDPSLSDADGDACARMAQCLAQSVSALLPKEGDVLLVGLGNRHITADALGSRVTENILVTRHLRGAQDERLTGRLRGVCAIAPGVLGLTGIETAEMVKGVVQQISPCAVIAVDALAARQASRIGTTVQITDTGILPGSGVGNHRMALTEETLRVPVIAVGVPMVVYAKVIARDALQALLCDMHEDARDEVVDELAAHAAGHGLDDLVVTPREVDAMLTSLCQTLSTGLNMALQPQLSREEIMACMHAVG